MTTFFDDLEQTLNDFRKDVKNGILQQVSNHNKNSNAHKSLFENKISKSSTNGLVKNDGTIMVSGTGSSNWATGNHTHTSVDIRTFHNFSTDTTTSGYMKFMSITIGRTWRDIPICFSLFKRHTQPTHIIFNAKYVSASTKYQLDYCYYHGDYDNSIYIHNSADNVFDFYIELDINSNVSVMNLEIPDRMLDATTITKLNNLVQSLPTSTTEAPLTEVTKNPCYVSEDTLNDAIGDAITYINQ